MIESIVIVHWQDRGYVAYLCFADANKNTIMSYPIKSFLYKLIERYCLENTHRINYT